MRALPSSSRDLPLLLPEWMLFPLLQMAACRTLEMLARGTRLRGDATRAPMQVRNGWRPHRRHLTQPALSKDDRFFVQTMGSTSQCRIKDASGEVWTFIDKVPVVSTQDLDANSVYPQPGEIACVVLEEFTDAGGRRVAVFDTNRL
jgi:hypothetical protein